MSANTAISISGASTRVIDLSAHLNNVAATSATATDAGQFNVWGNSFASLNLPAGPVVDVDGIEFRVGQLHSSEPDNVRCEGQHITVDPGRYDWLYVIASAERRVEDELALYFSDSNVDFEPIRISDFWAAPPAFGETVAFQSSTMHYPHHVQFGITATMWCQRVPIVRRADLVGLRLPRNSALHIVAATLQCTPVELGQ